MNVCVACVLSFGFGTFLMTIVRSNFYNKQIFHHLKAAGESIKHFTSKKQGEGENNGVTNNRPTSFITHNKNLYHLAVACKVSDSHSSMQCQCDDNSKQTSMIQSGMIFSVCGDDWLMLVVYDALFAFVWALQFVRQQIFVVLVSYCFQLKQWPTDDFIMERVRKYLTGETKSI